MNLSGKYGMVQIVSLQIIFASGLQEGCRERVNLTSYDVPLILYKLTLHVKLDSYYSRNL